MVRLMKGIARQVLHLFPEGHVMLQAQYDLLYLSGLRFASLRSIVCLPETAKLFD
jgi:hypothetical protein